MAAATKKLTVKDAFFEVLLEQWVEEGWQVHWYLQPAKKRPELLATPDTDTKIVHLYPHPSGIPPEKTGLHEMLHIRLGLSGEKRHEEICYYLENWIWARLGKRQKETLHKIFVAPLSTISQ